MILNSEVKEGNMMEYNILKSMAKTISSPALIADKDGRILCQNGQMKYVYRILEIKNIEDIHDIDISVNPSEEENINKFNVSGTNLSGIMYSIEDENKEIKYYFYIFDKTLTSERIISNVMEHIDEIVVTFDENGVIQRMNSICDQLLPFKRKDVLGRNISELVGLNMVENPIITQMIRDKKKIYRDIKYPDGRVISYTAIPIEGHNKKLVGGVLTGRNVSRILSLAKNISESNSDKPDVYISESESMKDITEMITRVAGSDVPVFIVGESGVGKEIIARSVWKQSSRRNKEFVAINCASIPTDLIESELFGYEKGAFTGANKDGKAGLIEVADGGTLFLDEIGELPIETQKKLLRVIQENAVMRIGSVKPKKVNVRYISATNKTVNELKDPKIFREDLYYRLSVIPVFIPSLRERREDILPISNYYIERFNKRYGRKIKLSKEAEKILIKRPWKGNIRELKNVMERLVILSGQDEIYSDQLEMVLNLDNVGEINDKNSDDFDNDDRKIIVRDIIDVDEAHRIVEQEIIKNAVDKYGSITKASEVIGINPSTVYRKIKSGYIKL